MFFNFYSDGKGGYRGYISDMPYEVDSLAASAVFLLMILIPIGCMIMLGELLLVPFACLILAVFLIFTPETDEIKQSVLLIKLKQALAVPLVYYAITCISYILGSYVHADESSILNLCTYVIGFIPAFALAAVTAWIGFPAVLLWAGAFFAGLNGGYPTTTNFILHAAYLEAFGLVIYGIVVAIKDRDKDGIHILPKLIAFGLGCLPLLVLDILPSMSDWLTVLLACVMYVAIYFVYGYVLKKPSLFADYLIHPILWLLFIYAIIRGYSMYSQYLFPSDVLQGLVYRFSHLINMVEPAFTLCNSFAGLLSDIIYGITKLFFAILPSVGLGGFNIAIPWFVGGVFGLIVVINICNLVGKTYTKIASRCY